MAKKPLAALKSENNSVPCFLHEYNCDGVKSQLYILWSHGNAEDIGCNDDIGMKARAWKANIIKHEYQGYGISPGSPSVSAIDRDIRIVYDFMTKMLQIPSQNIILFGRSIGTGPTIKLCRKLCSEAKNPLALILQSPYLSIRDIAKDIAGFVGFIAPKYWDSRSNIQKVTCPTLFIHGEQDDVIPCYHSQKLHGFCNSEKVLALSKTADHNEWNELDDIILPVTNFISDRAFNIGADIKDIPQVLCKPPKT
eukprot:CAMPEP_0168539562 /NCGR_PEP_ID=MMETSP0405-20121227/21908_1 /TAXON_ID=498012 /ORGANISM="Trichosphaerium sp, Strain Am-I-7 wt" /LENGTH=251 /DNA_ID=CAMNT_0008569161 /DNA_START=29 /DNA_END=780 /DNA_ORIENTATION=+